MAVFDDKVKFIEKAVKEFEDAVPQMERELLSEIYKQVLTKAVIDDGALSMTLRNIDLLRIIDEVYSKFNIKFQEKELKKLAENMLEVTNYNEAYYLEDFPEKKVVKLAGKLDEIEQIVGVKDGRIIKNSYLDKVAQGEQVRNRLKQYVTESVISKKDSREFAKGFKELVEGAEGQKGILDKYHRQYTYDLLNKVDAAENEFMATELGLTWFRYEGTIIKNTRAFCRKRVGEVFNIKETEDWKNDPTLIDKATKESYNPLVERGRYNCRHFIRWISDAKAKQLAPEKYEKYGDN